MDHNYEARYKRVILKPLDEANIENLRVLRNRLREFFTTQTIIEPEQQVVWYQNYLAKNDDIMFRVVKADDPNTFIGSIAIYDIDWENGSAEVGRTMIDNEIAPEKGLGAETTKACNLFAFDTLKLKKIVGSVLKDNDRMIKANLRAGYRIVGENENGDYLIEMTRDTINLD